MDTVQHHRAMLGICRQRAQMEGESEAFWLEEATIRERLIVLAQMAQSLEDGRALVRREQPRT